jgi:hypothetical protein
MANVVLVKCSTLKSEPGSALMVCLELVCGNCGALNTVNVVSQQQARQLAEWCPVCEDEQDPTPVTRDFHFSVLPEEDPPS